MTSKPKQVSPEQLAWIQEIRRNMHFDFKGSTWEEAEQFLRQFGRIYRIYRKEVERLSKKE